MAVSRYNPEYCNRVIRHCEEGGSIQSFAGVIGVNRRTVYDWRKVHPDFDAACERGVMLALSLAEKAHWKLAQEGGKTSGLEYRMGNLSGWEWRLKTTQETTGEGGGPVRYVVETGVPRPPVVNEG